MGLNGSCCGARDRQEQWEQMSVNRFNGSRAELWRGPHLTRTAQYSRMRSNCQNRSTECSFRCFRQQSGTCAGMGGFGEPCADPEQHLETVGVSKGGEA